MMKSNWNRVSMVAISAGIGALLTAGVLFVLSATGVIDGPSSGRSDPGTSTAFGQRIDELPTAEPTAEGTVGPPPSEAPAVRLVIPKIGVDAKVIPMGTDNNGVMQSPDNAYDVAWYTFTAKPGFPGNAVFSGHVDYHDVGKAVLWKMVRPANDSEELTEGDVVQVRLEDGTVYEYRVVSLNHYPVETAPVEQIIGPTPKESLTVITCSGSFDSSSLQYSHRAVLRAERVPPTPAAATAPAP